MNHHSDGTETEVAQGHRGPHSPRQHGRDTETSSPSFRAHPYNRRPSLSRHDIDSSSRIHLPLPNQSGHSQPRAAEVPRQVPPPSQAINIPGIASLVHGSPPSSWRKTEQESERYWHERGPRQEVQDHPRPRLDRSVSGDSSHSNRPSLPPLHTLGPSEPSSSNTPTPTSTSAPMSMPPPTHRRSNPSPPRFLYSRPTSPGPGPSSSSSRSIIHQHSNRHPPPPERHHSAMDYRNREPSPPLRAVRNTYDVPGRHHPRGPDGYYSQMPGYGSVPNHRSHPHMQMDPYTGRPLGQPTHGGPMRHHQDPDPRLVGPAGAVPGQSRRLAHLMSEQKRRESINTGFQALRKVVPSASPTDSKAVILRKAAAHIAQLETLLRTGGQASARPKTLSLEQDELMGSASDSGADLEDDDDAGSDGDRREPVVKMEHNSPRIWE